MFRKFTFLIIFTILNWRSQATVLGIDFGTDFVKVAVVAPGHAFEIALDPSSKRKSPNTVGFDQGERRFGNDAKTLVSKRPHQTFRHVNKLLGKSADAPILQDFSAQYYPYTFLNDEQRGTLRIAFGEDKSFSVEEISAMYLQHAQNMAVSYLESSTPIRDCVVTVPDFWTSKERQALLDAADLAGLNVLSLINENSAAALYYGVEYNYEINKTENFIFYNMGSTSTKVSVVEYGAYLKSITKRKNKTIGQVTVLGQGWDETLGGNAFDMALVKTLKKEAEAQLKVDLTTNFRSMARLRVAAETAKRKLSANKDVTVRITSLYLDEDFKMPITRDLFEELSQSLFDRMQAPIDRALERSGQKKEDITGIVLMGGGTRVPKVQDLLVAYLDGKELKRNLNTDEASALGAAFRAANESTTFRVRQIGFADKGAHGMSAVINNFEDFEAGEDLENCDFRKSADIFEKGSHYKRRKAVHFKHDKELYVSVAYLPDGDLPSGTTEHIQHYNVSGIERAVKDYAEKNTTDEKPKISLSFSVDLSGVKRLAKATATFQENVEVAIPRLVNTTTANATTTESTEDKKGEEEAKSEETGTTEEEGEEEEEATEDKAEEEASEATPEESDGTPEESDAVPEGDAEDGEEAADGEEATAGEDETPEATEEELTAEAPPVKPAAPEKAPEPVIEYDYVWQIKKRKVPLKIRAMGSDIYSMNKTQKAVSRKVLMDLDEADRALQETAAAFNDLEAYILEHRPYLYEDEDESIMKVSTEEEREELIALLTESEDWLYDEEEPSAGKFKAKLREVQKKVQPVFSRAYELTQRDHYVSVTKEHMVKLREMIVNLSETMTWVNKTEFEKLTKSTDEFEGWFTKKLEEQESKELTDEPAFRVDQVKTKIEKLSEEIRLIAIRPKPAEKPKKKKKKKKKKSNETETAETPPETSSSTDGEEGETSAETEREATGSEEEETTESPAEEDAATANEEQLEEDHDEL